MIEIPEVFIQRWNNGHNIQNWDKMDVREFEICHGK